MTQEYKNFAELCGAIHPVAEGVVCDLLKGHEGYHSAGEITQVPSYHWNEDKNVEYLAGQVRPTVEQVAWVFAHLDDHLCESGTFRHLIYHRLGFDHRAYSRLLRAGGMNISNAFCDLDEYQEKYGVLDSNGVYVPNLKDNPLTVTKESEENKEKDEDETTETVSKE